MKTGFTDPYVKNLTQPGRYTDATTHGLNLNIKSNGRKYWVFRYLYVGKRLDLALGVYPEISLKEARKRAAQARSNVLQGQRPVATWKTAAIPETSTTPLFKNFATECIATKKSEWSNPKHTDQWTNTIEQYANPVIGNLPLDEIETDHILRVLTPIWHTKTETASRLRGRIEWILASATTRRLRSGLNPATWRGHLETILPKPSKIATVTHHAALAYADVPNFLVKLRNKDGVTALALEFLILNVNRTGEVLGAFRSEVAADGLWVIPASRMKAGKEHRVPLGQRSLAILTVARSLDPSSKYLFSKEGKPLSSMAMSMLLRRMKADVTVHGFRSSFRDWVAEETDHSPEVAEMALAHTIRNQVEAAYRRGDLLSRRKVLMNDWQNYCLIESSENMNNSTVLLVA
ncbi:MAG: integrase [Alcaligenaceae bacterium]|nr:MAG: integrase [Alcaligenaceae bacterium]